MLLAIDHGTVQLENGTSAHAQRICGARVACLEGTAWITIDGDPRDIVLTRGKSFVVDSNAQVIVTALAAPTRFRFDAVDPASAPCNQPPSGPGRLRGLLKALSPSAVNPALAAAL